MDSGIQVLNFRFFDCGTWIPDPIVSGIHDSLSSIPDSKDQDSRFHGKNLLDSGIRIPLR